MSLLTDIIISIPIGITYNIIINKLADIVNEKEEYSKKIQRNLMITFTGGVLAIIIGYIIFDKNKHFKNRAIRYGLYTGSIILLTHTLFYNWNILANDTKLLLMALALIILFWLAYYVNYSEPIEPKQKNTINIKQISKKILVDANIDTDTDIDIDTDTDT